MSQQLDVDLVKERMKGKKFMNSNSCFFKNSSGALK